MSVDDPDGDFTEHETDTSMYRVYTGGRMRRRRAGGEWEDVNIEPPPRPKAPTPGWDLIPPAQQALLKIVDRNMAENTSATERNTTATERLGERLPAELRSGLRLQAWMFFAAMMVLVVAVVALSGRDMQMKVDREGLEVGTATAAPP